MSCCTISPLIILFASISSLLAAHASCITNDCTLPATEYRGQINCTLGDPGDWCSPLPSAGRDLPPPTPVNLQVSRYRSNDKSNKFEFNITWQLGSNGNIENLKGYRIEIKSEDGNAYEACNLMTFTNTLKDQDRNVTFYYDCSSGFNGGIQMNVDYYLTVTSFPVGPDTRIDKSIRFYKDCESSISVPHGNAIDLVHDFYIIGETVKIVCNAGYTLVGAEYVTCLSNGWTEYPQCKKSGVYAEVFANYSVLVGYELLPIHSPYRVCLRSDEDARIKWVKENVAQTFVIYENVTVGIWRAFVRCEECENTHEYPSQYFIIADPTTPGSHRITLGSHRTTLMTTSLPIGINNTSATKSILTMTFVGVIGGLCLITLMYLIRKRRNNKVEEDKLSIMDDVDPQSSIEDVYIHEQTFPNPDIVTIATYDIENTENIVTKPSGEF
ncbi:uncharacterized protein [Antedon mediterranea]|uniref:uncharacterized protein n=1 Tax=Antedon mediterranea TaxID=105859 RepID=UPI003AF50C18